MAETTTHQGKSQAVWLSLLARRERIAYRSRRAFSEGAVTTLVKLHLEDTPSSESCRSQARETRI